MRLYNKYRDASFVLKMSFAFLLSLLVALVFREHAELLNTLGVLLIRLLSLIAIPVIFLTVVLAVNKMNISQLGKLGGKLILYYTITTALAVLIGVSLALFFNPGKNLTLPNTSVDKSEIH